MGGSDGNAGSFSRSSIRAVVIGDHGTGKSTLIAAAEKEVFPRNGVPHVLSSKCLPAKVFTDHVPIELIDTSPSMKFRETLVEELRKADVVILTYAYDDSISFDHLTTFWLPDLRRLKVSVPVIVAGCKTDLIKSEVDHKKKEMLPIMEQFREINGFIECSSLHLIKVRRVFWFAQLVVLHPVVPLFDQETWTLKPLCIKALKRIFFLCDHDRDGALSDAEFNDFHVKSFNTTPLDPSAISYIKRDVQMVQCTGVNSHGHLTFTGFHVLFKDFIENGSVLMAWAILRKFGYNNDLKLRDDLLAFPIKQYPDQSVELTNEAVEFLTGIFCFLDSDNDGALQPSELDDLFSTTIESPWGEARYKEAVEKTEMGGLSLDGFLSLWALMTLLDPARCLANLMYIGYAGDPASAIRGTRKRPIDRKKRKSARNVFHCFVFGPKNAGKSALLNSFVGRPFSGTYTSTTNEHFVANVVDHLGVSKKTLVLREIPEGRVTNLLSDKESLAACDIAIFVHDRSDESSWMRATELLVEVASHGEASGFEVPCLIVAAKDDLDPCQMTIQDYTWVGQDMGIQAPIPVSMKLGDTNALFQRIITAAECPRLSFPEIECGEKCKSISQSFSCVSCEHEAWRFGYSVYKKNH